MGSEKNPSLFRESETHRNIKKVSFSFFFCVNNTPFGNAEADPLLRIHTEKNLNSKNDDMDTILLPFFRISLLAANVSRKGNVLKKSYDEHHGRKMLKLLRVTVEGLLRQECSRARP